MSRESLKISPTGVRGIVGESLTPQLVTSFAGAFGNYSGVGPILVGTDGRPSGEMVKQAVFAGLLGVGSTPVDLGVVPTPALMLRVRESGARGGINISGRRSPAEWNALRFIGPDGSVLRPHQAAELTDIYHQGVYSRARAHDIPQVRRDDSAVLHHRTAIVAGVDAAAIRARRFRVALDAAAGVAAPATAALVEALGGQVVSPGGDADVGFVLDPDGARLALIDERGQAAGGDVTLALAVDHWLGRRTRSMPVVVNASTSRAVDEVAARHGATVVRTRVGETHVVQTMRDLGAEIGGEGDGGVIAAPFNLGRDALVAAALVLESLATTGQPASARFASLPSYVLVQDALLCPAREVAPALRWLRQAYRDRPVDLTDGVKVQWDDRWFLARPSAGEPLIRLLAEAPTRDAAQALLTEALEHLSPAA